MYFLIVLLSHFGSFASEYVDCSKNPCQKECLPPGMKLHCIPVYEYVEKPRVPLVEGQKLVYMSPTKSPYDLIEKQMLPFFQNWGSSCPGDSHSQSPNRRSNTVSVLNYADLSLQRDFKLNQSLKNTNTQTIILQLSEEHLRLSQIEWSIFLDKISNQRGCLILSPFPKKDVVNKKRIAQLERLISDKSHSCQVVDVSDEFYSGPRQCKEKTKAAQESCQLNRWIAQVQFKSCDLDPRTFVRDGGGAAAPEVESGLGQ